jgi:hypothetical protein
MTHHVPQDADELFALRRLYPEISDEDLQEVQENLDRYVDLIGRITKRLLDDPEAYEEFKRMVDKNDVKDLDR